MEKDKVFKKNPNIVSRVIDNEVILVPVFRTSKEAESIYTLNPSASKVWDLIDGKRTLGDIKEIILRNFDSQPEEADKEITKLIKDLREIKAVK